MKYTFNSRLRRQKQAQFEVQTRQWYTVKKPKPKQGKKGWRWRLSLLVALTEALI